MIINPGMSEEAKGGVSSFNGRTGDVVPSSGDYCVEQITRSAGRSMAGQTVEPVQGATVTAGEGAEVFNDYQDRTFGADEGYSLVKPQLGNVASGNRAHAEGGATTASGANSHAEGYGTMASGSASHAEGGAFTGSEGSKATAYAAHAEGISTEASGKYSHAEGSSTEASGDYSHAEGLYTYARKAGTHAGGAHTYADGEYSFAHGYKSDARGKYSVVFGYWNSSYADFQTTIGKCAVISSQESNRFIIGKGQDYNNRANCFRVTDTGVYATGAHNTSGADYAELFEWLDGNPEGADRCGRFVTLDGEKIRLAGPGDDFILGIVSGNPSVVGDVHDDQWQGMYLYDVFGRPLWEDVEVPDVTVEEPDQEDPESTVTRVIIPAHIEHRQRLNPAYDGSQPYQPRTQRPEWDAVGMLGKLVAVDDGTCEVNGWCTVGEGGAATYSAARTRYRVMARLDECHVRVLIL